jgi:predicted DNA-binding antitoxin AbrB/MazE fold protein
MEIIYSDRYTLLVRTPMTTKVHAIYRNGVLTPSVPLPVAEGTEVELVVTADVKPGSLAEALNEIAQLPAEGLQDGFSGADHDQILYRAPKNK